MTHMHTISRHAARGLGAFLMLAAVAACTPGADDAASRVGSAPGAADTVAGTAAPRPVPQVAATAPTATMSETTTPAPPTPATTPTARAAPAGPRRVDFHGVDLTGVGYDQGSPAAPVVLVNFSDFGCPFCARFSQETYPTIERDYVKTGKVFFKYVPFVMGMFPNGDQAARAAECAAEAGRFWPMHDRLYAEQRAWKGTRAPYELFQREARRVGLDAGRFDACYAKEGRHPRTRQANAAAEALGVRVTPSFLVGDRGVEGALPLAQFRELLDAALREAAKK